MSQHFEPAQRATAQVLQALQRHIGKANGASAEQLVRELHWRGLDLDTRQLRRHIEALRREGQHVCGHPTTGYFIAENEAELLETCDYLHDRAMTSLAQVARMRGVSVPDLRGQLRLPT